MAFQYFHLMNSDLIEFHESLRLRNTLLNENGIQVFHIR